MLYYILSILVVLSQVLAEDSCLHPLNTVYKELNCKPKTAEGSSCPTSYDCSQYLNRDKSKCLIDGKEYNDNDTFKDGYCLASCKCLKYGPQPDARPTCANIECPEHFGPRVPENCHLEHELDLCCATKTVCEEDSSKPVCVVGNVTYKYGQKFYPEKEPCKRCICKEGYQGVDEEPFCVPVECQTPIHYQTNIDEGCHPVLYKRDGCCPVSWKCYDAQDEISDDPPTIQSNESEKCTFGKLSIPIGKSLKKRKGEPSCTCEIPPYLTCLMV